MNINNRVRNVDGNRNVITTYTNNTIIPDSIDFNFLNKSDRVGSSIKFGTDYSVNEHLILNAEINYDKHYHSGKMNKIIFHLFNTRKLFMKKMIRKIMPSLKHYGSCF